MVTNKGDGRFLDDKESMQALVDLMPDRHKGAYQGFTALSLVAGFPNRKLVVYTLHDGAPRDLSVLTLGDLEMTRVGGPTVEVADERGKGLLTVHPQQWRDREVFLHVPQNFIFKWKGKYAANGGLQFAPHYAVLVKTRSRVDKQSEGDTFCETFNDFRARFPGVRVAY